MFNKVLNILAWLFFLLSLVAYLVDDVAIEPVYLVLVAIFCILAPRHLEHF